MQGLTRRHLLGGGVLLAGGYLVAHAVGHRPMGEVTSPYLGSANRRTLEAAIEALLPKGADFRDVAEGIDGFLGQGDPVLSGQLAIALAVLEHSGGAGLLAFRRFSRRDVAERRDILEAWRLSSLGFRRQIGDALRRVALFSWYTRPDAWEAIGYDGPWVGR